MGELDAVYNIVKNAIRHMDEQGIPQWDDVYPSKEKLAKDVERQEAFVIETDGRAVGFIVINEEQSPEYAGVEWKYSGRVLVVHRLTIAPGYQRRGMAARLMDFEEDVATVEGYDCIRLDAFIPNPAAVGLYENRGYRNAGIVRFRKGEFCCYEKAIGVE